MRAAGRGLAWHGADLGSVSVDSDDENKNLSLVCCLERPSHIPRIFV